MYTIVITFTLLFAIQISANNVDVCNIHNTPLMKAGDKSYYMGTYFQMNWYKAMEYCRYHGMHLVSIETDDEVENLSRLISNLGFTDAVYGFWTSGNDLSDANEYVWLGNGKDFTLSDSSWLPGEPNHTHNNTEHCLGFWNNDSFDYKLNDFVCSENHYFICEHICDSN